jgi:hypothetical protein
MVGSWSSSPQAFARSALTTGRLLATGRLRSPRSHVGRRIGFADGSVFWVFRETLFAAPSPDRSVLVVRFQLRLLGRNRLGHALFRAESLANTPLFAGFPGFRTKLWLTDERTGEYRGLYDWAGAGAAESYATALTGLLRPLCVPGSLGSHVEPDATRDRYLRAPTVGGGQAGDWWAPVEPVRRA